VIYGSLSGFIQLKKCHGTIKLVKYKGTKTSSGFYFRDIFSLHSSQIFEDPAETETIAVSRKLSIDEFTFRIARIRDSFSKIVHKSLLK